MTSTSITTAVILAALAVAAPSQASGASCEPPLNQLAATAGGLSRYLVGIGTPAWANVKASAPAPAAATPCGPAATVSAVRSASAAQARFFVLLRAFPTAPTARQWRARYRPLVRAAVTADAAYLAVVGRLAADAVASFNAAAHCGDAPNPPNLCDNETLPLTVADAAPSGAAAALVASDRLQASRLLEAARP